MLVRTTLKKLLLVRVGLFLPDPVLQGFGHFGLELFDRLGFLRAIFGIPHGFEGVLDLSRQLGYAREFVQRVSGTHASFPRRPQIREFHFKIPVFFGLYQPVNPDEVATPPVDQGFGELVFVTVSSSCVLLPFRSVRFRPVEREGDLEHGRDFRIGRGELEVFPDKTEKRLQVFLPEIRIKFDFFRNSPVVEGVLMDFPMLGKAVLPSIPYRDGS